jgi:uncharacterized protein
MKRVEDEGQVDLNKQFQDFIADRAFACVGAKSALAKDQMTFFVGQSLCENDDDHRLLAQLYRFIDGYRRAPVVYTTFVAIFKNPRDLSEVEFERALWRRLSALHQLDSMHYAWDSRVSSDSASPMFGFSIMSEACFVIGLHAAASRTARRFQHPALVFNVHDQFEQLRRENRFDVLRDAIRTRDAAMDGAPNPMVSNFGEITEARQYSGRRVDDRWRCPFSGPVTERAARA